MNGSAGPPIRVMLIEDQELIRRAVCLMLQGCPDFLVVGEADSAREALARYEQMRPDVTLVDLGLPDLDGVEVIRRIRHADPSARFIVLSTYGGDQDVVRAFKAGAQSYLLKSMPQEELFSCIRAVSQGQQWIPQEIASLALSVQAAPGLSSQETRILEQLAQGLSNKEIAALLFISERTVKNHVSHILTKLGVSSRTEAALVALRRGFARLA